MGGGGGAVLELEEQSSCSAKWPDGMGNDKIQLFRPEAAGNIGGTETKDLIQKQLLELKDLDFARDGKCSERVDTMKNDTAAKNVCEFRSEAARGGGNFLLQEKHRLQLDDGIGEPQGRAQGIGFVE